MRFQIIGAIRVALGELSPNVYKGFPRATPKQELRATVLKEAGLRDAGFAAHDAKPIVNFSVDLEIAMNFFRLSFHSK